MAQNKMPFDAPETQAVAGKPCPICGKIARIETSPFCSKRCADVDLGRWLGGVYAVPTDEPGQAVPLDRED